MSNLPLQSAVNHNDDNDEQITPSTNKFSSLNSRITSPLIIKRQQNIETEIANNQAYDEIHDLQPKHSSIKKTNNDHSKQYYQSKSNSSHDLMQGNYYDQTRYDVISSSNHLSDPQLIHINVDEYKKTITPNSTSKTNSNKTRSTSPPFGHTSESIQQGIAQSAGILLELNKKQHQQKSSMKNNYQSHDRTTLDSYLLNENETKKQRSSSASSSASDCSTSDSSSSNKCHDASEKSNIPYKKLTNDEDEDNEVLNEQTQKPATESTYLNKNFSQTYGTQSISERSKYLPNNGYNSHGSSITTKSSSDNSGSVRTNSGSDNDEESDEEPFNNSSISNNSNSTSSKCINKPNDIRYSHSSEQNNYQPGRTNTSRSEQIGNNDEHHLQVPRFKQLPNDDTNGNKTLSKLNSGTDHSTLPNTSTWPLQQSSVNQISSLSSSSHQNRNLVDRHEQQQYQSNSSRNNSRQHQVRTTKKRKQSQQQETIRTELIPGHRGDLDVDELVMFIDGNPPKQRQNSSSLNSTDANKPKLNTLNDSNSNKTASRKKSRKITKSLQQSISATDDHENEISTSVAFNQSHSETNYVDDESNLTPHSIVDITNQSLEDRAVSTTNNNEYLSDTTNITAATMTNGVNSVPNWFEQTRDISSPTDDSNSLHLSSTITNHSNSEPISEPFVTVTHRRRLIKERRQDNTSSSIRSSGLPPQPVPPSQFSSFSNNNSDKRRISSVKHNGTQRTAAQPNHLHNKSINTSSTSVEENKSNKNIGNSNAILSEPISQQSPSSTSNPIPEPTLEKRQSSPRLSSHSSSSSLSSLIKRQSKPPPVVFLNKSVDVELNDVSFGFDLDSTPLNKSLDETNEKSSTNDLDAEPTNASMPSMTGFNQSIDSGTEKTTRKSQQRYYRGPQFYSGSDIRPHHHHRAYPSQPLPTQPSYIDPLLLLNYNQQRLQSYTHPLTYMNLMRGSYVLPQSQYVYLPTTLTNPTTVSTTATNETNGDDEVNPTSSESIPEPVVVIAAPPAPMYYHPSLNKKPYMDSDQQQTTPHATPISSLYPAVPPVYPAHYFYPTHVPHLLPSHPAYFQPITSPSLLIDTKSEQNDIDDIDINDDDYEKSTKLYSQARQQSSSDIMSNALQLVYSQQRRNAQTDRFNLDDLTAYLAMKWTETVDHYEQGDNRILLVDE